ncbi:MAG: glutamate--tRNA ligase [Candidatus Bathyarchaeota archaeon]|nr:glutamate--tRNA ligase [Candidatus Bathyarchaeota archaeon]
MSNEDIKAAASKFAAHNASQHDGKASTGSVIGKVLAEYPALKQRVKEVVPVINQAIKEVNSWTQEQQQRFIEEKYPELLEKKKVKEAKKTLPPLENVDKWPMVKTRFAPNPDGALHLGSAEPIIFCDEYAKMYDGHFILRYEDTSAEVKPPILEMYDAILEDLDWLGVKVDEKYIQSDRIELYHKYAVKVLEEGNAYVCTCEPEDFRELYMKSCACPCRDLPVEEQLKRWNMMLDGTYKKGDAVVRIKTDLNDPNPAVRDWPALRISDVEHPRQGNKYRVWPLYNFSCGLDDHLMGVTHIIRGKEHDVNTTRQRWLQKHLGWQYPEIINVGRLGLEVGILSKSKIRAGIEEGTYSGWDDPRLGTLKALRKRGFQPETIRAIMIHIGPKPVNVTISWDNIAAENRKLIDPSANRFFFISTPVKFTVSDIPTSHVAKLPLHPDHPEKGTRDYVITPENGSFTFNISGSDLEKLKVGKLVRLMSVMNFEVTEVSSGEVKARFHSEEYQVAREAKAPFIHWLPMGVGVEGKVIMPDASVVKGLIEEQCLDMKIDEMFQFERFGFCRVDSVEPFVAYYSHK